MEGVTTKNNPVITPEEMLTPQDIQAGVDILSVIASNNSPEKLEMFNAWTNKQNQQLWQAVPQWLKQKICSLIDVLRGHPNASQNPSNYPG